MNIMTKIEKELYKSIKRLIKHPHSSVCKHYAAILIIEAMINSGIKVDKNLIESISSDSEGDIRTISLINKKL